jgi:hypothetical protein
MHGVAGCIEGCVDIPSRAVHARVATWAARAAAAAATPPPAPASPPPPAAAAAAAGTSTGGWRFAAGGLAPVTRTTRTRPREHARPARAPGRRALSWRACDARGGAWGDGPLLAGRVRAGPYIRNQPTKNLWVAPLQQISNKFNLVTRIQQTFDHLSAAHAAHDVECACIILGAFKKMTTEITECQPMIAKISVQETIHPKIVLSFQIFFPLFRNF